MNYLNVPKLMDRLVISRTTAYALMNRADFPAVRIGKCLRVSEADLEKWLEAQKNHAEL